MRVDKRMLEHFRKFRRPKIYLPPPLFAEEPQKGWGT
jgi:hypothetical protein